MTSVSSDNIIISSPLKDSSTSPQQQQSLPLEKDIPSSGDASKINFNDNIIGVEYWGYQIGGNVIPANSRIKKTILPSWKEWQNNPIPDEQYDSWKKTKAFSNGIAVVAGKLWRGPYKDKYLVCIDCDNKKAIEEFLTRCFPEIKTLEELSQITIVELHADNKDKVHIYLIVEKPLKNRIGISGTVKKDDNIPSIEVKSEGKSYVVCSPSVHKDGCKYEIIGTTTPAILNIEQSEKLEESINQIHKKYGSFVDGNNNNHIPIEELYKDSFVAPKGSRHHQLLRLMCSLLRKLKTSKSIDQIKAISSDWNQKHCNPPLNDKEFEKQWKCSLKYIEKGDESSFPSESSQDKLITKKINDTPPIFYYADSHAKIIGRFKKIQYKEDTRQIIEKIEFTNRIIDAVPKKIYVYESNPLSHTSPDRIKIVFESSVCKDFVVGPYSDIEAIVRELENKQLILNSKNKTEALACIINAYKEKKLVEVQDGMTTEGYYLIEGKIKVVGNTQNITSDLDEEKVKKCIDFLNHLANNGWKNKNIFPTVLKWGIISPFIFSVKYNCRNFVPWLLLYGKGQSGKSTLGKIVLAIWNLDEKVRSKGFTNIDTIPRLGNAISKDTYPILIDEVGSLSTNNNFGKYTNIIECIKHSIENRVCRESHIEKRYQETLALSPLILTSNYAPPNDGSFNRRLTRLHFPAEEKKEAEEQVEFKEVFDKNKKHLSVLGDFAASYIMDNPVKLLDTNWHDLAKEILEWFYGLVKADKPEWIEYFEEQRDAIDESSERTHYDLRAFLLDTINNTWIRHEKLDYSEKNHDLSSKLNFCLNNNLISFLSKSNDNDLIITHDIMTQIKRNGAIEDIPSLKDVGNITGFEYVSRYVNGKKMRVLKGSKEVFNEFINSVMN